jgi:hypothetical protein
VRLGYSTCIAMASIREAVFVAFQAFALALAPGDLVNKECVVCREGSVSDGSGAETGNPSDCLSSGVG